jgi:hypothetical protein
MALGLCFTFQAESQLINTAPKKPVVEEKKTAPKLALPLKKGSLAPIKKKDTATKKVENTNDDNLQSQPKTLPVNFPASSSNQVLEHASNKLHFVEQFDDNSFGWFVGSTKDYDLNIVGGKYRMVSGLENSSWYVSKMIDMDVDKDFTVSVIAKWQEGIENNRFGLQFCSDQKGENFMFFGVSANGHFMIADYKGGKWFPMKDWEKSDKVNKKYVPNLLTIKKEGKIISYYLNEHQVFSMPFEGGFGRAVGFRLHEKQTIEFDQLEINATRFLIPDKMGMMKSAPFFYDPFNMNNGWPTPIEMDNAMIIDEGKFTIKGLKKGIDRFITRSFPINLQGNFSISCKAKWISGTDNNGFGIAFGSDATKSPLFFYTITANGYFALIQTLSSSILQIIPWTNSDLVKIGYNVNEIEIRKVGKYLELYINGKMANKILSPALDGNYFGLRVSENQTVEFDDFSVIEMK